jgi:hypothetical protein
LPTVAVIDARPRTNGEGPDLRARVSGGQLTIGIGCGYAVGRNVDVVIDSAFAGESLPFIAGAYDPHRDSATDARQGIVRAPVAGRFATASRIGDGVRRGEIVGMLDQLPVAAPRSGVLAGLSARGARIRQGDAIVEVDASGERARCFGPAPGPLGIARAVANALAARTATSTAREIETVPP